MCLFEGIRVRVSFHVFFLTVHSFSAFLNILRNSLAHSIRYFGRVPGRKA